MTSQNLSRRELALGRYPWLEGAIKKYQAGSTLQMIADEVGLTRQRVNQIFKDDMGVTMRPRNPRIEDRLTRTEQFDICQAYLTGARMREISKTYGISAPSIYRVLHLHDIRTKKIQTKAEEDWILQSYAQGYPVPEISEVININETTIYNILKSNGVERTRRARKGGLVR